MGSDKFHLLATGQKFEQKWSKIGCDLTCKSNSVKFLRITIDNQLKFHNHFMCYCKLKTPSLFIILILSHLPLKCSEFAII